MNNLSKKIIVSVIALCVFAAGVSNVTAAPLTLPTVSSNVKIVYYNEFTGGSPAFGASALTGATSFDNVGTLKDALNSGNFMGIQDGVITFKDATKNVEQYDVLTGAGLLETPAGLLKPISLLSPNPHAGEMLISADDVKNEAIIDTYDLGVMILDTDGSVSTYYTTTGTLYADYTYTSLTGGGNMDGVAMNAIKADARFVGVENAYFVTLNAAGTGLELYSTLNGVYVGPWSVVTPLFGGPLSGKTVAEAVQDTHGVAGLTFVGVGETDLAFYDSVNKAMVYYNHANFLNTWAGGAITSANGSLTLGDFAGTLDDAITGGRFLGVANSNLLFIDTVGQMQAYNGVTGVGAGIYPAQPLEGPQANEAVDNPNFIDTVDLGTAYIDEDGTTSVYLTVQTLWNDQKWKTFTGGALNGLAPTKANIVATEDTLFYNIDADGSLNAYTYVDGKPWPADLWTWTTFTGGFLDGENVDSAINNEVAGATFLGIGGDGLFFAIANEPGISVTGSTTVTEGATTTVNVRLLLPPTAPVIVNLTVTPGAEATISPIALTFTPENWKVAQTVVITAIDDTLVDGTKTEVLGYTVSSEDAGYSALTSTDALTVSVLDNDSTVEEPTEESPKSSTKQGSRKKSTPKKTSVPTEQVLGESTDVSCDDEIKTFIRFGEVNDTADVSLLQRFLNEREGEKLTVNGTYDEATLMAVHRYQSKYFEQVIKPWGVNKTTGYVYKTTRAHINARMCAQTKVSACQQPFTTFHREGDTGGEVAKIQSFLGDLGYYNGTHSGVFDQKVDTAVRSFQKEFSARILAPWGTSVPTGYWYKTTRATANSLLECVEKEN